MKLLALLSSFLLCLRRPPRESFANESAPAQVELFHFANQLVPDASGWVQLSPYGDFPNVNGKGLPVIQRFRKPDAEAIVNEFKSLANLPQRLLGLPWYVGHPDHLRFRGQPGHTDTAAKGRVKDLEAREDGLYANVKWSAAGKQLLEDEAFHGHSVHWQAIPAGSEGGKQIFCPRGLKSVGFTNQPQIPVKPASLANEETDQPEPVEIRISDKTFKVLLVDDESAGLANEVAAVLADLATAQAETERLTLALANERKARATELVSGLVKAGKLKTADRDAKITELAGAGEGYEALANALGAAAPVVKTTSKTEGLGRQNVELQADVRQRGVRFDELMRKREQAFANESSMERFDAVAASEAGKQLFTQMQRPGAEAE